MSHKNELNRRDFNRLSAAALGGMMSAAAIGCGSGEAPEEPTGDANADTSTDVAMTGKHACRGLNECKGQGISGENTCAGAGTCSTTKDHDCHYENECKYQGGCGEKPGANECKGKGECATPIKDEGTWAKARKLFEERMTAAGKELQPAPEVMM